MNNNIPTHKVYTIRKTSETQGYWLEIGAMWAHKDGNGFNISLDAAPINGRLVIRKSGEKREPTEENIAE